MGRKRDRVRDSAGGVRTVGTGRVGVYVKKNPTSRWNKQTETSMHNNVILLLLLYVLCAM